MTPPASPVSGADHTAAGPWLLSCPAAKPSSSRPDLRSRRTEAGDHEGALAIFMSAVSGQDRATCRAVLEEHLPGAVTQAIKDADAFFGIRTD